jgi:hypothetical protein
MMCECGNYGDDDGDDDEYGIHRDGGKIIKMVTKQ